VFITISGHAERRTDCFPSVFRTRVRLFGHAVVEQHRREGNDAHAEKRSAQTSRHEFEATNLSDLHDKRENFDYATRASPNFRSPTDGFRKFRRRREFVPPPGRFYTAPGRLFGKSFARYYREISVMLSCSYGATAVGKSRANGQTSRDGSAILFETGHVRVTFQSRCDRSFNARGRRSHRMNETWLLLFGFDGAI